MLNICEAVKEAKRIGYELGVLLAVVPKKDFLEVVGILAEEAFFTQDDVGREADYWAKQIESRLT